MKIGRFLTKTEWGLLVLSGLFLVLMVTWIQRTDASGDAGSYTITTRESAAQEAVVPESALPVNINTAAAEELDVLPGIGPALAGRIIAYREEHGPCRTVEGLLEVKGIGEATLEEFRQEITLGEETEP